MRRELPGQPGHAAVLEALHLRHQHAAAPGLARADRLRGARGLGEHCVERMVRPELPRQARDGLVQGDVQVPIRTKEGRRRFGERSQRDCDCDRARAEARAEGAPSVCRGAASGASPARLDTVVAAAFSLPFPVRASTAHVTCSWLRLRVLLGACCLEAARREVLNTMIALSFVLLSRLTPTITPESFPIAAALGSVCHERKTGTIHARQLWMVQTGDGKACSCKRARSPCNVKGSGT